MFHKTAFLILWSLFTVFQHVQGEDLKTIDGRIFHNYRIEKTNSLGVGIIHSQGYAWILFSNLPPNIAEQYSPDLTTGNGVYYGYSVIGITRKSLKIKHKDGETWLPLEVLPKFLLKKYEKEIAKKKKKYAQRKASGQEIVDGKWKTAEEFSTAPQYGKISVKAQGYGQNDYEALQDAFRDAIRKAIGAYVVTQSSLKENDFNEEIFVNADAIVSAYKVYTRSMEDGIVKIEIGAEVIRNKFLKFLKKREHNEISQMDVINLLNKRNALNAAIKSIPYIFNDYVKNSCAINKVGQFELDANDSAEGDTVDLLVNYSVKFNYEAFQTFGERLTSLLDRVCIASRTYKIPLDHNWRNIREIEDKFLKHYAANKSDRLVYFLVNNGKFYNMRCYLVPNQVFDAIYTSAFNYYGSNICTVTLDFKMKKIIGSRKTFRADIRSWQEAGYYSRHLMFFDRLVYNVRDQEHNAKITVKMSVDDVKSLQSCHFRIFPGIHGEYIYALDQRNESKMLDLAENNYYIPAMIALEEQFKNRGWFHKAALMGSRYAQKKVNWNNAGLGLDIDYRFRVWSAPQDSAVKKGMILKSVDGVNVPHSPEELSKRIGALPPGQRVSLKFSDGTQIHLETKNL